jgi:anti-sigma factor ChrR (cupin superfamily)
MKCQEYIFKLTSGQLDEADVATRLQAAQHRLTCRHCRAFTRNDARLDQILADYQAHLTESGPDPVSGDSDSP